MRDASTPLARLVCRLGATLILIVTAGCGGGGGSGGPPPPPLTPAPTGFSYPSPQIYARGTAIAPLMQWRLAVSATMSY